jgi:hypothetical protein
MKTNRRFCALKQAINLVWGGDLRLRWPQKSQPRNGVREIFIPAVGEITHDTVSAMNWIARDAKKVPPNRAKFDSSKRLISL